MINNERDFPIERYECSNCGTVVESKAGTPQKNLKCCDKPNLQLLMKEEVTEEQKQKDKEILRQCYGEMIEIHKRYLDWDEDEIKLQCIWDIGTYCYELFETYPYKFVTSMKGAGKTRLLKLTEALCWNGKLTSGISDSALFRMANGYTLLFDEAEQIARKEKQSQREILNSGYKKGGKVIRVREKMTNTGKIYINEEFSTYSPKMLANIFGMENVLGDRCISSILEKSNNPRFTKILEDFSTNPDILRIKRTLAKIQCSLCSVVTDFKCIEWNCYITTLTTLTTFDTLTTHTTHTTPTTTTTLSSPSPPKKEEKDSLEEIEKEQFFNKVEKTNLNGRSLELFFPLFLISKELGENVLADILRIAEKKSRTAKEDDFIENADIAFIDFISQQDIFSNFISISDLTNQFKLFYTSEEEDSNRWLNTRWFGRALKRLNLVKEKRRMGQGIEVILDIAKAKEKLKMFKKVEEPKPQ